MTRSRSGRWRRRSLRSSTVTTTSTNVGTVNVKAARFAVAALFVTALLQAVVVVLSGSVALLDGRSNLAVMFDNDSAGEEARARIEGVRHLFVPEPLGDVLRRNAGCQGERRPRVPEVVQPGPNASRSSACCGVRMANHLISLIPGARTACQR